MAVVALLSALPKHSKNFGVCAICVNVDWTFLLREVLQRQPLIKAAITAHRKIAHPSLMLFKKIPPAVAITNIGLGVEVMINKVLACGKSMRFCR